MPFKQFIEFLNERVLITLSVVIDIHLFHFLKMEMLIQNQEEEKKRLREQLQGELTAQEDQIVNMSAASMRQARELRRVFIKENQELKDQFKAMQECNEENMKKIKQLSELVEKQEKEKREVLQGIKNNDNEDKEALIKKINSRHEKEMKMLRDDMNVKLNDVIKTAPHVDKEKFRTPCLIQERTDALGDLHGKIKETYEEQQAIERPGVLKTVLRFVAGVVPAAGIVASAVFPPIAPIVTPVTGLVGAAAGFVAENISSIM